MALQEVADGAGRDRPGFHVDPGVRLAFSAHSAASGSSPKVSNFREAHA